MCCAYAYIVNMTSYMKIVFCNFVLIVFFFFNDTATTEIYTLSLHDALPICPWFRTWRPARPMGCSCAMPACRRSEEHTSELQSLRHLVCRLLLEKKKKKMNTVSSPCAEILCLVARTQSPTLSNAFGCWLTDI